MPYIIAVIAFILITVVHIIDRHFANQKKDDQQTREISLIKEELLGEIHKYQEKSMELENIAYHDHVTGIYNLNCFVKKAEEALLSYPTENFAVVVFEVDNLSKIDLLYGLEESDKVLVYIAQAMQSLLYGKQIYARLNNDNFGLLLRYANQKDILDQLSAISANLNNYSRRFKLYVSYGIYLVKDRTKKITEMTNLADLAKRTIEPNQPDRYAFFTDELNARFLEDTQMAKEMNYALEHHQFLMYLQPEIDLHIYRIVAAEALVRWNHPTKGLLSPYQFIPLFESNNFIIKLDYYIWENACKTIRHWIDNKIQPVPISINVSPIHFDQPKFVDVLNSYIEKYKIPKNMIELELPERAFADLTLDIIKTIKTLRSEGFILCIDNFGSYHSPLNLLKDLPIQVMKLDRKFLMQNTSTEDGLTIIRYLNAMAKELNLTVVAEGVETNEQANFLTEIGCDLAQGYFFAQPMAVRDFDRLNKIVVNSNYYPNEYYPLLKDILPEDDLEDSLLPSSTDIQ
ncbi:putative bifunctional diguanylate cyclase/phosphodiesterase [Anaerosporobacter faecicola]|uniref:putative bifunctional diguanylate cyclase/phosphodiesterase n=1 Tax=Anaerosporobacter faecicola TaxID=2718714 RepID=UPI00143A3ED0|nr:bifunctional diguanylate cyclase/phosphodiesterase [Anaerosporobacter faecicola]